MSQFDETQFYICGDKSNMLNYKGKVFSILYPRDQIEEDIVNNCSNCEYFGSWNGCQIMRCVNCDKNGCGAFIKGVELNTFNSCSASNTYLKDVNWSAIGDKNIEDTDMLNKTEDKISLIEILQERYILDMRDHPYKCININDIIFPEFKNAYEQVLADEDQEREDQEGEDQEEEKINIFLNEQKWFDMKIKEYQESLEEGEIKEGDQGGDQGGEAEEISLINIAGQPTSFIGKDANKLREYMRDPKINWNNLANNDNNISMFPGTLADTHIISFENMMFLLDNSDASMFIVTSYDISDSEEDEDLQQLKSSRVTSEKVTASIFDFPTKQSARLSEDECGFYGGEEFSIKCLDLLGKGDR